MSQARQQLGAAGEALACQFLVNQGYQILARNSKTQYGEVDIVARTANCLVIVEVKSKRSRSYGPPAEMVNRAKQAKLRILTQILAQHYSMNNYRIDVIAINYADQPPSLSHFVNAVSS